MTVALAVLAAVLYGIADFAGGIGSRRISAVTLLLWSYPLGAVLMVGMLFAFPGHLDARALLFGVAGGVAGLLGVIVLYHLMTVAPINVVSPVTAVLAAIVPVAVGVTIGERPATAAWFGIALGLVAVVLVSRTDESDPHGRVSTRVIVLALLSGLGFGMYFVFLGRAGAGSGLWPLTISRLASAALIVPIARARGVAARARGAKTPVRGRMLGIIVVVGTCDAFANMFFLLATHTGLLSLVSVLTSLYPATTVLLAVTVLREPLSWLQRSGLALAAGAIVLITV